MKLKMILIAIAFLCLTLVVPVASQANWCYNTGATCTNQTSWPGNCGNGARQSPIDIVSANATSDSNLKPFTFTNFDSQTAMASINNINRTVKVLLGEVLTVSGGNLPETYNVLEFRFHWGDGVTAPGSEHTLDGKRFPMELQIVTVKSSLDEMTALQDSEGYAILAFFIEVDEIVIDQPASWKTLTTHLTSITADGTSDPITDSISLDDLLPGVDRTKFYRYMGSLTTPNCDEAVVWTVFKNPVTVSCNLISSFAMVNDTELIPVVNNYRTIKPEQPVTYSNYSTYSSSSSSPKTCSSFGLLLFGLALWMS